MANITQLYNIEPGELRELIRSVIAEVIPTANAEKKPEIIDRDTLCQRLNITHPTIILWEKKGRIPRLRIGAQVRYDWNKVLAALEDKPKK